MKAMAMSATDFGENLKRNLKRNEPEDSKNLPEDLAFKCVRPDVSFYISLSSKY